MNSQLHSSNPPTGRSRPPRKSRWGLRSGGCGSRRGRWWSPSQFPIRSMIWPPMTHVTYTIEARNTVTRDDAHDADVLREAREEVDEQDLDAVERVVEDGGDQPELEQSDDRVLVDADDAVVGVRTPADHGRIDHVGEQEEDDRDAGDPVEQPGVLPLMALVDGAVVALLLARSGRHRGIPPSLSRPGTASGDAEPANGRAESTQFRPARSVAGARSGDPERDHHAVAAWGRSSRRSVRPRRSARCARGWPRVRSSGSSSSTRPDHSTLSQM